MKISRLVAMTLSVVISLSFVSCTVKEKDGLGSQPLQSEAVSHGDDSSQITQSEADTLSNVTSAGDSKTETEVSDKNPTTSSTVSKNQTQNISPIKPNNSVVSSKPSSTGSSVQTPVDTEKPADKTPLTAVSEDDYFGWQLLKKSGTEAEKKAYQLFATKVGNYENKITFDFSITKSEVEKAYSYYCEDYPQHFWRGSSHTISTVGTAVKSVKLDGYLYNGDTAKIKQLKAKVDKELNAVLSKLSGSMSDFDKEIAIHDYIIDKTVYKDAENAHSIVGVLVDGKAVCEGYSLTFQHLMRLAGVQCITVRGTFNGDAHMWNMIKLDGDYYHVDVTSDDPVMNTGEQVETFDYFNLTASEIKKNHVVSGNAFEIPTANHTEYEFFNKTGQAYKKLTVENFANSIVYAYKHGYHYAYMRFVGVDFADVKNFVAKNYYSIINKANEILHKEGIASNGNISFMYDELRNIFDLKIDPKAM